MAHIQTNVRSGGRAHRLLPLALATLFTFEWSATHNSNQARAAEPGWIALFNGKDLDDWTPKIKGFDLGENYGNTFHVDNGVLKGTS
jgi:hypothetical protein